MRVSAASAALGLLALASSSAALRIPFTQTRRSIESRSSALSVQKISKAQATSPTNTVDLSDVHDLIYIANVSIGGNDYPVQLDTGSSDLWVSSSSLVKVVKQTPIQYNLTYGIGWAFGNVSYSQVEFSGVTVPNQALLAASSAVNPALSYGAEGILGLGFTQLSTIDALVNRTGASTGRSFLYNAFRDNLQTPNFISLALERASDTADEIQGVITVGEYDSSYSAVANTTHHSTWPEAYPSRWNILLSAVLVGDRAIAVSTNVTGVASNRAVALLDSGTSYTYGPASVVNQIYSGISGASYSTAIGQWVVPCSAEVDMALQFGNDVYPLHPLDVVPTSLSDSNTCVGSFIPQDISIGAGEFDWLVGDNVLRSVYSVFDFGDFNDNTGVETGNPYIQLLSIIDPDKASSEFHSLRGGQAKSNITYNASNSTSLPSTTSGGVSIPSNLAATLDKIANFLPAMLGILALNALVLIIVAVVGICWFCRRRSKDGSSGKRNKKTNRASALAPMDMSPLSPIPESARSPTPGEHVYESVPGVDEPEPALTAKGADQISQLRPFPTMGGDRPQSMMNPSMRPMSTAYPPPNRPMSGYHRMSSATDDTLWSPQRPGFREDGGKLKSTFSDRPMSMAAASMMGGETGSHRRQDSSMSSSSRFPSQQGDAQTVQPQTVALGPPSRAPPMPPSPTGSEGRQQPPSTPPPPSPSGDNPFRSPVTSISGSHVGPTSEDALFTPPRVQFQQNGANMLRPGGAPVNRPMSMAIPVAYQRPPGTPPAGMASQQPLQPMQPFQPMLQQQPQQPMADDGELAPPRPRFAQEGGLRPGGGPVGDRPRSVA